MPPSDFECPKWVGLRPSYGPFNNTTSTESGAVQLSIDTALYIEAQDKLTRVVTADGEAMNRTSLKEPADQLDPTLFWQADRSALVRVSAIAQIRTNELGWPALSLRDHSERPPVAQTFAAGLIVM